MKQIAFASKLGKSNISKLYNKNSALFVCTLKIDCYLVLAKPCKEQSKFCILHSWILVKFKKRPFEKKNTLSLKPLHTLDWKINKPFFWLFFVSIVCFDVQNRIEFTEVNFSEQNQFYSFFKNLPPCNFFRIRNEKYIKRFFLIPPSVFSVNF